jgi:pilus assembly protein Flp/PilA
MLRRLRAAVVEFVRNEDGPTAVEYAVMLALIIVVCLAAVSTLGAKSSSTFTSVGRSIGAS